ncbi:uncharacterized protein LOC144005735 isoform X2 [Festucalex cinctus]
MSTHIGLSQYDASVGDDVLERHPRDDVKKISQYLECSAGPSSQNPKTKRPPEADSDSGDSLFLTQLPTPQARRTLRRRKSSRHTFVTELEDSGEDASSSQSDEDDHEMRRNKKKKGTIKLPKYSFSFITEGKRKARCALLTKQNQKFHNYVMGGFFKCVELWQGVDDLHEGLPTVDQYDDISPLTADEGEDKSGDKDIKVVEKNHFLAKSKAKWQQPWYTPPQCTEQHQEGNGVPQDTVSNEVTRSCTPLANDKNDERCSSSTCDEPSVLGNHESQRSDVAQTQPPRSKRTLLPEETPDLVDAETTTVSLPIKQESMSEEESDWQYRQEEGEDAAVSVTTETTDAHDDLQIHENRMDNLSHIANTPRPEDNSGDGTSEQVKENTRQENELLDFSVKKDAMCSVNQDELMEKSIQIEVEEDSCIISKPLNGERQKKKKKKKRLHPEPESLDTTAVSQEAAKRKKNREDDIDETRHVADGTEKMSEDNVVRKKKKKKSSRTEVGECVSEMENKKNWTFSFLFAEVAESSALEAELHDRLKKKKKKSARPESAEDFAGASSHCVKVVSEGKTRKHDSQAETPVERHESADGSGSKKKKKKKKRRKNQSYCETEETRAVENVESGELNSSLHQAHSAESSHGGATFGSDGPENDTLNDLKDMKKRKKRKKQLTNQAELEGMLLCDECVQCEETKKERRQLKPSLTLVTLETNSPFRMPPLVSVKKNKRKKTVLTHQLYN